MKRFIQISLFFLLLVSANAQDASFAWAKKMGAAFTELPKSIKVDALGNVYTCGTFNGTIDFDPGSGVFNLVSHGSSYDAFIQKLDANGNFLWARNFGKWSFVNVDARGIEVDAFGNVYTIGSFWGSADFNPGAADFLLESGGYNGFISKLDINGNFIWAKKIGGDDALLYANAIKLDASSNIYITGHFSGLSDFDPNSGTSLLLNNDSYDVYIEKLTSSGDFVWVKQMGNPLEDDESLAITVDPGGNVLTTGIFKNTADFDPSAAVFNLVGNSYNEIFVSKLSGSGAFVWAKQLGGFGDDVPGSITTDAVGNVYTTGSFKFDADFDPGVANYNLTSFGGTDIFVSKLIADGSFGWAKQIGGSSDDNGVSVSVVNGSVYYAGSFIGTVDFNPGSPINNLVGAGGPDVFISRLGSDGSYGWAKRIGIDYGEKPAAMHVDASESIYTTGVFFQTCDFDPGAGVFNLTSASGADIFIQKMTKEVPTPVKLLSFTATAKNCGEINLTWTTANEQNNKGFYVEQSDDGRVFKHVDFVAAKPQSNNQYQVSLKGLLLEKYYYRLKQIDKDGAFEYFNVISTTLNCGKSGISIYPTLADNLLHIGGLNNQYKGKIYIYDMHGKLCILSDVSGTNATINVQQLVAGSYMLSANGQRFRFIKSGQ
jgi:Beta-propeller repeat